MFSCLSSYYCAFENMHLFTLNTFKTILFIFDVQRSIMIFLGAIFSSVILHECCSASWISSLIACHFGIFLVPVSLNTTLLSSTFGTSIICVFECIFQPSIMSHMRLMLFSVFFALGLLTGCFWWLACGLANLHRCSNLLLNHLLNS